MKSSAKQQTFESAKVLESSVKLPAKKDDGESMYKLKMIGFLIISFFLMYWAMTPTRKAPYKGKKK